MPLRPVVAGILEFDGNERLAHAVAGLFPVPGECQAHGGVHVAVDADGHVRLAIGTGHAQSVAATDSEVDGRARERPAFAFLAPPVHELSWIRPRPEKCVRIRADDA